MTSLFSSTSCLEQELSLQNHHKINRLNEVWNASDLNRTIKFIREGSFSRVCLQLPDELLNFAVQIEEQLKKHVDANIYVLADTSYGSCCVDEIAATHVQAECIIHFGHACLSKVTRLPVLYIFPKDPVDVDAFVEQFRSTITDRAEKVFIFYSVGTFHVIDTIANKLHQSNYLNIEIGKLAEDEDPDILCWSIKNNQNTDNSLCIYIGRDNQSFFNISTAIKSRKWFLFDIDESVLKETQPMDTKFIMKRSHYVEKCKDAQSLGIVVGTLTTKGYLDAIKHIQELASQRGVKTYLFSVGKINPAKLANFSDIDCFVLVGCPENNLYTSREFYKPLVSVFEAELAMNPAWHFEAPETYSTDFREILPEGKLYRSSHVSKGSSAAEMDVSLVTGKVRGFRADESAANDGGGDCMTLQEKARNEIAEMNSLQKLNERSFRGLEQNLGKDEPARIEKGRKGLAIKYDLEQ